MMFIELVMWNVERMVKRFRWVVGFAILLVCLSTVYSDTANGIYYTFGMVQPLVFLQVIVFFIALRKVYVGSAVPFLLRARTRRTFWLARILSTCAFSYGTVFLLLLGYMIIKYVIHGSIFPTTQDPVLSVLNAHWMQSLLLIYNLLSLGFASTLVLLEVFQLLLNSEIISYVFLVTMVILSATSYVIPTEPISRMIFLFSPFTRMSLFANINYHVSPISSLLFFLLLLSAGMFVGGYLFSRKDLAQ